MADVSERMLYEGVSVEICFLPPGPTLGDMIQLCSVHSANFPPSGSYKFSQLADLQFSQVDDYFGVRSLADDGADVVVWLYPLVEGDPVYHHPGPFDGFRLDYNVLRNPIRHVAYFLRCVRAFANLGPYKVVYVTRTCSLGEPPDLSPIEEDIAAIIAHWRTKGIEPGSRQALRINY